MRYGVVKEFCIDEFGEKYITYGIVVKENRKEVRRISDVSRSALRLKIFCFKCNYLKLSYIHIDEAIEDFLLMQNK